MTYPLFTPPSHLQGDYAPTKYDEGALMFVLLASMSTVTCLFALRAYSIHLNHIWVEVPIIDFPKSFLNAIKYANGFPLFVFSFILFFWGVCIIGSVFAGIAIARPWGGRLGVRYISGPVLQYFLPPSNKKDGIEIAEGLNLSQRDEVRHQVLFGSSGSGKTTTVFPQIKQAIARGDRCVIWDEKAGFIEVLENVLILSPWDKRARRWAISEDLKDKSAIQDFASHACPVPVSGDAVWSKAAAAIVIACCIMLSATKEKWFLIDLRRQLLSVQLDLKLMQTVVNGYYPEASGIVADLKSKALSSVTFQLSASLQSLLMLGEFDEELEKLGNKSLSLSHYLKPGLTVKRGRFLPVLLPGHPTAPDLSSVFCGAVIHYVATNLAGRADTQPNVDPVWLFLDEFIQLGRQDGVIRLLEVGRSKSVRVVIGLQGPEQVVRVYGHEHVLKTILNNTLTKFHFQYNDHDAAGWASESLGVNFWKVRRINYSENKSMSFNDVESPVFQPNDLMKKLGPSKTGVTSILTGFLQHPTLMFFPHLTDKKIRVARETIRILVPSPVPEYVASGAVHAVHPLSTSPDAPQPQPQTDTKTGSQQPRAVVIQPPQSVALVQTPVATNFIDPDFDGPEDVGVEIIGGAIEDAIVPGLGIAIDLIDAATTTATTTSSTTESTPVSAVSVQKRKFKKRLLENEGGLE